MMGKKNIHHCPNRKITPTSKKRLLQTIKVIRYQSHDVIQVSKWDGFLLGLLRLLDTRQKDVMNAKQTRIIFISCEL